MHRRQIRVREVAVILRILFRTHRVGILFVVVPAAGLLDNGFSFLDQLDLSCTLSLDRSSDGLKGVQVLHLGTCSEFLTSDLTDRKVDIGTHRALLQFAVGCAEILNHHTQFFQISDNFLRGSHIRLGDDLDQRNAASVVIDERTVLPLIVNQLSCIFLHMDLVDANFLLSRCGVDLHISIVADRQIQLGNLIVLRVVRVEIVLPVEFAELVDFAVCSQSDAQGVIDNLLI